MAKNGNTKQKRVVTIGGGTGSFVLLSGLKKHPLHISAIVSMADDGGSTGVLRDEMGVLPPGDVRQCLAALARATQEVRDLFSYRFTSGDLRGHNAGNLFLSALEKTTGSFSKAVAVAGKILNVYGRVIPVTEGDMRLLVELQNGVVLEGESKLDDDERVRSIGVKGVALAHPVRATKGAIEAIEKADIVVIGPGDVFGSIIPNLLVQGVREALQNTAAKICVVANVTNKKGLTDNYAAADYVAIIEKHIGAGEVDIVICNTEEPSDLVASRYEEQEGKGMFVTCAANASASYTTMAGNYLHHEEQTVEEDALSHTRSFIRHDSDKLAQTIVECIQD